MLAIGAVAAAATFDAAKGEVRAIEMEGSTEAITNASTNFIAGK
jgi:hypothetical protein